MILGHYAVGFIGKKMAPNASLGTVMLAALWLDLVWSVFLLVGVERVRVEAGATRAMPVFFEYFPFSHGFVSAIAWSLLFGSAYWLIRRNRVTASVLAACVFSHWWLDAIAHDQDLPFAYADSTTVGLGLWRSLIATFLVEATLFGIGVAVYLRRYQARTPFGNYLFVGFVSALLVIYTSLFVGYVPSGTTEVAIVTLGQWAFVGLAYVLNAHFEAKIPLLDIQIPEREAA